MVKEGLPSQKRQNLQEALISAATRTIAERGQQGVRARELASEVGCAVGAIYNVFPDIDALLQAVKARTLDALEADVVAELGPENLDTREEAQERLLALARVYLEFANKNRRLWFSAFEHSSPETPSLEAYMVRLDAILTNVESPLRPLLPNAPPHQLRLLARALFASVHGVIALGLDRKLGPLSLQELHWQVRALVAATLRGLADDPSTVSA